MVMNPLLTLAPQVIALVTLPLVEFSRFSIVYLLYAWGVSLQMSIICEPMGRNFVRTGDRVARSVVSEAAT